MAPNETLRGRPWAVSLHGGHSGQFCDHGKGSLRDMVEAAVACGYHTFGMAEHAPRYESRHLFREEIALGWDNATLLRIFEEYAAESQRLVDEFSDRLMLLRGFEAEVVPMHRYADLMLGLRSRFQFDYVVGSVHWVDDVIVDYSEEEFGRIVDSFGGLERLALRYYGQVAEMARMLRPEVVGHLDLLRKYAADAPELESLSVRKAAEKALEAIRECDCILDVNTVPLRRGSDMPYPAPWLLRLANESYGIPFCFGDDSHTPADVGAGIAEARDYLLRNGVGAITHLAREEGQIVRKTVPLE